MPLFTEQELAELANEAEPALIGRTAIRACIKHGYDITDEAVVGELLASAYRYGHQDAEREQYNYELDLLELQGMADMY